MPADAEDVVRRLRTRTLGISMLLDGTLDDAAALIERQSAEIATLRTIVNAIVSAVGFFDPDNEEQIDEIGIEFSTRFHKLKDEIATLRAQVAALEKECERARVAVCSPIPARDAPPS